MTTLFNGTITTAGTVISGTVQHLHDKRIVGAVAIFDYGSGGPNCKAWLQTTPDEGTTWIDVANWAFTTSDATRAFALGLPSFGTANLTPTDATLGDNAIVQFPIGDSVRAKVISTGTYAGTTTLKVHLVAKDF
jgi:exosome complex RNA-binding protein Csl4